MLDNLVGIAVRVVFIVKMNFDESRHHRWWLMADS